MNSGRVAHRLASAWRVKILPRLRNSGTRLRRRVTRVRREEIEAVLDTLMGNEVGILMVHSSLSRCGTIEGGADGVIEALANRCETLCFPTHTYCYPEKQGEVGPPFDPAATPSQVGMITEVFRQRADSVRSRHPTHSVTASGPQADELCEGHERTDTPCGAGTPYQRMIRKQCAALMFGVSMHSYTFFHTAEDESGSCLAYEEGIQDRLRTMSSDGSVLELRSYRQSRVPRRFREMGAMLERCGMLTRSPLGLGELLYIPDCLLVHNLMVGRLREHPDFLEAASTVPLDEKA